MLVVLGVAAVGCSHSTAGSGHADQNVFDAKKMAADIEHSPQGAKLGNVVCPEKQPVTPGTTFDCVSGQARIHIKVQSYDGDYSWTPQFSTG
jgi:hypothetical protein